VDLSLEPLLQNIHHTPFGLFVYLMTPSKLQPLVLYNVASTYLLPESPASTLRIMIQTVTDIAVACACCTTRIVLVFGVIQHDPRTYEHTHTHTHTHTRPSWNNGSGSYKLQSQPPILISIITSQGLLRRRTKPFS
jgi:hypothetical protein